MVLNGGLPDVQWKPIIIMHGDHWKKMTNLHVYTSLLMNIFSENWVDFHSLCSTFTERLIKDSSISSDSQLFLLMHTFVYWVTHLNYSLQNSSQSYAQTFLFLWVSFTPHTSFGISITRGRSVGSKENPLTEYTIAHMPSMHKLFFFFTDPHAKGVFLLYLWKIPIKIYYIVNVKDHTK